MSYDPNDLEPGVPVWTGITISEADSDLSAVERECFYFGHENELGKCVHCGMPKDRQ